MTCIATSPRTNLLSHPKPYHDIYKQLESTGAPVHDPKNNHTLLPPPTLSFIGSSPHNNPKTCTVILPKWNPPLLLLILITTASNKPNVSLYLVANFQQTYHPKNVLLHLTPNRDWNKYVNLLRVLRTGLSLPFWQTPQRSFTTTATCTPAALWTSTLLCHHPPNSNSLRSYQPGPPQTAVEPNK